MRWGHHKTKVKTMSKHRANLEKKYQSKGLSKSEAEKAADKRIKAEKTAMVAVGVAVIATGAYFAHKHYSMNADVVIKKGKAIQHMGRYGEDLTKPFYASHLKSDNKAYAKNNFFGSNWDTQKTLMSNTDIKSAGKKVSMETFSDWVSSSQIAKERFAPNLENYENLTKKQQKNLISRTYNNFNKDIAEYQNQKLASEFYQKLSEKGYNALRDVNDQQHTGKKSPILIFESMSEIMTTKVRDLS